MLLYKNNIYNRYFLVMNSEREGNPNEKTAVA